MDFRRFWAADSVWLPELAAADIQQMLLLHPILSSEAYEHSIKARSKNITK